MSSNNITRNSETNLVQCYHNQNGLYMFFDLQRKPSLLLNPVFDFTLWFSYRELKDKKNPLSQILAFVCREQVKCFRSLGQLSFSPQSLKYDCTNPDWSGALINQSLLRVKWHLLRRLSWSSMKMFTTITEFIAGERSQQTDTTSV